MNLTERIEELKAKTAEIIAQHPHMESITWYINDVPYNEFDSYRRMSNEGRPDNEYIKEHECGGRMFYHAANTYVAKAEIVIWSVPVKIKHTYEVIEN